MKKLFQLIIANAFILAMLLPVRLAFAASAGLSLSPASGSVANGSTLTIDIHENSGSEPVNDVQADMTYDSAKFDFVAINNSAAFAYAFQSTGGGGTINLNRGALPAVTGDQVVASVVLRAKVASGSGAVNFSASSQVYSANNNNNIYSGGSGGTYTLTAGGSSSSSSSSGSSSSSSSSGGSSSSTSGGGSSSSSSGGGGTSTSTSGGGGTTTRPSSGSTTSHATSTSTSNTSDQTAPVISNVSVSDVTATTAAVTWTTSEPASSEVDFGPDQNYGYSALDQALVSDHKLTLNSAVITASTEYHFAVKSIDASGNIASSGDSSFTTAAEASTAKSSNTALNVVKVSMAIILLGLLVGGFIFWRRRNSDGTDAGGQPPQVQTIQPPTTFIPTPPPPPTQ